MRVIEKSALLPYSARQMFELVNNVSAYPEYLDGCVGVEVLEDSGEQMKARLDLSRAGVQLSFSTTNDLTPHEQIRMELHDGPLETLVGEWQFMELTELACKVSLKLAFEIRQGLVGKAAASLLDSVANSLVDNVCERAREVYNRN